MSLAEELATKVYATMPAAMPCNSVFAIALVNAALERAAQECDHESENLSGNNARTADACASRIRALQSSRG